MKKTTTLFVATALYCVAPVLSPAQQQPAIGFTENKGQVADQDGKPVPQVLFQLGESGSVLYVTETGLSYVLTKAQETATESRDGLPVQNKLSYSRLDMVLEGGSIRKDKITYEDELPGYANYYYAHCPDGILGVKSWRKMTIHDVYPGIDWVLQKNSTNSVEADFIVHPGADPATVRLTYKGAETFSTNHDKNQLVIHTRCGVVKEGQLACRTLGDDQPVASTYRVKGNSVRFHVGRYNKKKDLLIDPPLIWSAPQTTSSVSYAFSAAVPADASGDICVTGYTDATDFPTLNPYQGMLSSNEDMIVQRLNSSGTRVWSTYYGSTNYEGGKGIAADNNGNCYVAGYTGSTTFPVLNPVQASYGGGTYDLALVKFNAAGVRQWATWYGGTSTDYGNAITCSPSGTIYVTGYTGSSNFPVVSATQSSKDFSNDAFVMKLNAASAVQWATFYGGDDDDRGRAITLHGGSVYIAGSTLSGTFPGTSGGFQSSNASAYNAEDGFIAQLDTAAGAHQFASYYGGTDADFAQGVAVDASGKVFITGYTLSSDLPIAHSGAAYIDSTLGNIGMHDAFVAMCSATGANLDWSTYFGGGNPDLAMSIISDPNGVYITGRTASTDLPLQLPPDNIYYQSTQGDGGNYNDMFIAWFYSTDQSLLWSTYWGDALDNEGYAIAQGQAGNLYVTGIDNNNVQTLKFGAPVLTGMAEHSNTGTLQLGPVPAVDFVEAAFDLQTAQELHCSLYDMNGKKLRSWTAAGNAGANRLHIETGSLATGLYLLDISGEGNTLRKTFMKE